MSTEQAPEPKPTAKRRYIPTFRRSSPTASPSSSSSSSILSLLTLTTLALPPLLYIITLGLTLATIYTPHYVQADVFTSGPPETAGQFLNRSQHLSPFYTCTAKFPTEADPFFFEEKCVRRPFLGDKGTRACEATFSDVSRVCPKVTAAAELYTSAAVLTGLAVLLSAAYAVAAWTRRERHAYHGVDGEGTRRSEGPPVGSRVVMHAFGSFATLVALAGCGCLVMGQIVGVSSLVIEGSPDITAFLETQTRFYLDKGALDFSTAGYVCGLVGVFVAVTRCGTYWR